MIRFSFFAVLLFLGLACQTLAAQNTISSSDKGIDRRAHGAIDEFGNENMNILSAVRDDDDDDDDDRRKVFKIKKACAKKIKALKKKKCKPCKCRCRRRRGGRGDDDDDDDRR